MTNETREENVKKFLLENPDVRSLMSRILDDLDKLKSTNEDAWRILVIALAKEEKEVTKEKIKEREMHMYDEMQHASLQDRTMLLVHDAIYMTYMETGKYDPVAVRNWFGYDKEVRKILNQMPEDVFNATFGKMAEEIIKEIHQPATAVNDGKDQPKIRYTSNSCEAMYMDD